jgi:molybdopterin synthase sulfur carrier subunit
MESSMAMPAVTVLFPHALRERAGGRGSVVAEGRTVREVIDALERDFPGMRFNLCHETGELRAYVNIFLDQDNIRYLQGLDTAVHAGATMRILQSVAGG